MSVLNPFLGEQRAAAHAFFQRITDVPDLADHLKVDRDVESFSPAPMVVFVSLDELVYLHGLGEPSTRCLRRPAAWLTHGRALCISQWPTRRRRWARRTPSRQC